MRLLYNGTCCHKVMKPVMHCFSRFLLLTRSGFRLVCFEIIESSITSYQSESGSNIDESGGIIFAMAAWQKCQLIEQFIILFLRFKLNFFNIIIRNILSDTLGWNLETKANVIFDSEQTVLFKVGRIQN